MIINNIQVEEIKPRIFLLNFDSQYNMAMHFLRYQEYYESPSLRFRGKIFTIIDFMEWYSKKYGKGAFTYPKDWDGFNLSLSIIEDVLINKSPIIDYNKYDEDMEKIVAYCYKTLNKNSDDEAYLIGTYGKKKAALKHELAHAFFYTNKEYEKKMVKLVKSLDKNARKKLFNILKEYGYTRKVFVDEAQAFIATGLTENMGGLFTVSERKPFISLFKEYYLEGVVVAKPKKRKRFHYWYLNSF